MEWNQFISVFSEKLKVLQKSIIPLYKMNKLKSGPEFIGSSVYCNYGPIRFIITAKHVLELIVPDRPWIQYSSEEMREIQFEAFVMAKDEELDIGILQVTNMPDIYKPIPYEFFGTFKEDDVYQHLLIGCPASSSKKSSPRKQRLKFQGYLTSAAEKKEYDRLNWNRTKKFIVLFKKENVFDENRNKITFPNPNGMSGGGVFQFHEKNHLEIRLVGIMTDWDTNRKNAIVATRIECVNNLFKIHRIRRMKNAI